jgi:LacI family transcriptional regulator
MSTIRDVARRAGVAPITVSRVINNSGYVSPATRQRVEAAIAELQYVPNTLARSLRSKRTKTIALVLTDVTNPFWTTVARGVEDVAWRMPPAKGDSIWSCVTPTSPRPSKRIT